YRLPSFPYTTLFRSSALPHAPLADAICAPPVTACFDPLVPGAQRWHSGSMCGRYASFREAQALADAFDVEEITDAARELPASYNVAPTEQVRIVVDRVPKAQRPHTSNARSHGADTSGGGPSGADTSDG